MLLRIGADDRYPHVRVMDGFDEMPDSLDIDSFYLHVVDELLRCFPRIIGFREHLCRAIDSTPEPWPNGQHPRDKGRNLCVLMNPEIIAAEGEIVYDEACLSVIDFSAEVKRHAMVKVRGFDRHGKSVDIEAEGLMAICLQHEIDHLNGKLFIDHISSLKRALYKRKLQKMLRDDDKD